MSNAVYEMVELAASGLLTFFTANPLALVAVAIAVFIAVLFSIGDGLIGMNVKLLNWLAVRSAGDTRIKIEVIAAGVVSLLLLLVILVLAVFLLGLIVLLLLVLAGAVFDVGMFKSI